MEPNDPSRIRVAVIGSGPSGAYAADHLLNHPGEEIEVDMFERLPTPWGLVRAGVAPDHPKIKSVARVFERTAAHPRFRYFGNVELGTHVTRGELLDRYDAVIYAIGTPDDQPMSVPGDDLPGSWGATDFVGWYNGHPDQRDLEFDLSSRRAVVVGNGNVAVDIARMLTLTDAELRATDMADHAIEALTRSSVEEILVVGRRGPEQAAFTTPELRELGELAGADIDVDPVELAIPEELQELEPDARVQRNLEILRGFASRARGTGRRRIALRFLLSPVRILGDRRVEGIELVRNDLIRSDDGSPRAQATESRAIVPTGLVLSAIGYRGRSTRGIGLDEPRGTIPHERGRVSPGEYAVGWVKRGPSGVIGTNKKCALETVTTLLADLRLGRLPVPAQRTSADAMAAFLATRQPRIVSFAGWRSIDDHEQTLGARAGRPRVKLTHVRDMLEIAAPVASERPSGSGLDLPYSPEQFLDRAPGSSG
jgi:ferredoxin--NADP+ reductase